jgi:uncharacterized membrane protein
MKVRTSALAIGCVMLGLGFAGPAYTQLPRPGGGAPQGQGDMFTFRVCNKARPTLFVAMLYKVGGDSWRYVGWAEYKPGECAPIRGSYPTNDFYWYAEDGPGKITYAGNDAQACVNPKDSFDRTVSGDYTCQPGEKIVGFTKIDQKGINEGITLLD